MKTVKVFIRLFDWWKKKRKHQGKISSLTTISSESAITGALERL